VTVTEPWMQEVASACARLPWTVFLEKPPGIDAAAAHAIETVAREQRRNVFVGLNRRFLSSTRLALEDLNARNSGPRFIHVQDRQSIDEAKAAGQPDNVLRTWMYANSIHVIDYLTVFGRGEISDVQHMTRWKPEGVPVLLAKVAFSSGDLGLYEGIWQGPGPWAVTVTHAERRWEMRPLEKAVFQNAGERSLNTTENHAWDSEFKPGFRLQAEHAVAAAQGKPNTLPTLREAVKTMDLIERIFS
jgi:predicted dehydrogenase